MWYKIIQITNWFGELNERYKLVRDFNNAAKMAFVSGNAPTLLELKIVEGDANFKHAFSKYFGSGIRIKSLSGRQLEHSEMVDIGKVILENSELVRKLVSLGWDTLFVTSDAGVKGLKWALKDFLNLGGFLGQNEENEPL